MRFDRIEPAGFVILVAIHAATRVLEIDVTISSGTDSHALEDPHGRGEAYDVSVRAYQPVTTVALCSFLRQALGERFTVLYESPHTPDDPTLARIATINPHATGPHIHVQRKKGTTFPPAPSASLRA